MEVLDVGDRYCPFPNRIYVCYKITMYKFRTKSDNRIECPARQTNELMRDGNGYIHYKCPETNFFQRDLGSTAFILIHPL